MVEINSIAAQQRVIQSLSQLSAKDLMFVADLVDFLRLRQPISILDSSELDSSEAPQHRSASLADLLEFAGSWEGDDIRDCLQLVYENRAQTEF